jgi:hypothetical protein
MFKKTIIYAALAALALANPIVAQEKFIWIEGEEAIKTNLTSNNWLKGDNRKLLSQGDAFSCLNDRTNLPKPGFVLWKFTSPSEGVYHPYFRHGYQAHMGTIRFRFVKLGADGKLVSRPAPEDDWIELDLDAEIVDRMDIGKYRTIEWSRQPPVQLEAGLYYLDMQVLGPNPNKIKEANAPVWTVIDAICLSPAPFTPSGASKPGETPKAGAGAAGAADYY